MTTSVKIENVPTLLLNSHALKRMIEANSWNCRNKLPQQS